MIAAEEAPDTRKSAQRNLDLSRPVEEYNDEDYYTEEELKEILGEKGFAEYYDYYEYYKELLEKQRQDDIDYYYADISDADYQPSVPAQDAPALSASSGVLQLVNNLSQESKEEVRSVASGASNENRVGNRIIDESKV